MQKYKNRTILKRNTNISSWIWWVLANQLVFLAFYMNLYWIQNNEYVKIYFFGLFFSRLTAYIPFFIKKQKYTFYQTFFSSSKSVKNVHTQAWTILYNFAHNGNWKLTKKKQKILYSEPKCPSSSPELLRQEYKHFQYVYHILIPTYRDSLLKVTFFANGQNRYLKFEMHWLFI